VGGHEHGGEISGIIPFPAVLDINRLLVSFWQGRLIIEDQNTSSTMAFFLTPRLIEPHRIFD
jgi:hypothetical protein